MNTDMYNLYYALLAIIPLSAAPRAVACLIKINIDPDQEQMYKTRLKNVVLFVVVAEITWSVLYLVYGYLL